MKIYELCKIWNNRKKIRNISILLLFIIIILTIFSKKNGEGIVIPEDMVFVPDGFFTMGSNEGNNNERPAHKVYLKAFFIDKYEVSNALYKKFIEATGHRNPKYWDDERFNAPDQPVVGVSYDDAIAFAMWAGKRLPTEAEWEKAVRGKDQRIWPWGNKWDPDLDPDWDPDTEDHYANIYGKNDGYEFTSPVDSYPQGASPYGALNMSGNAWEWCADWYDEDYYHDSPLFNPKGPAKGTMRVLRGGSWVNKVDSVQTTKRIRNYPDVRTDFYGFRCAKST